jgi:hypothetical protein
MADLADIRDRMDAATTVDETIAAQEELEAWYLDQTPLNETAQDALDAALAVDSGLQD